jgi:DNA-binding GntR family transcriptional regulator
MWSLPLFRMRRRTLDEAIRDSYIDALCIDWQEGAAISQSRTQDQVQRVSRADHVYESLRNAIIQGQLEPGSRLNQVDIATELDVSERTVREALMQLISEGLLTREPFTEVRVVKLAVKEIEEILRMRILLEGWAVELAASEISQEELDRMRGLLPRMEAEAAAASGPALRALYREFHGIAFSACRKKYLGEMVIRLFDRMLPYVAPKSSAEDVPRRIDMDPQYFRRLVMALESGSGKKAREIVVGHLGAMIEALQGESSELPPCTAERIPTVRRTDTCEGGDKRKHDGSLKERCL